MNKGVFSKLVATFTLIISISFIITAAFLSYWFDSYYYNQRKAQLLNESQFIGTAAVNYVQGNISNDRINETIGYIGKYLSANIWLVDNYGYVYAASDINQKNLIGTQLVTSELQELRLGHTVEKTGTYGKVFTIQMHTFEVPVIYMGMFQGAIVMHTSLKEISGPLKKVYEIIWLSAILAILASCIVIYIISQKIIIEPLSKINYVADRISKGQFDKRVEISSDDEIGSLAKSFNSMADSLEEVEKNRRFFISNVSHEIRSPITSIKGFISGILDGIIPQNKEKYYLSIAYEETQRLTRLVNGLLDLSAIEEGQFILKTEEVDINEIIRIAVIKFETKIKAKKVKVDVSMHEDKLLVIGDKDRLIQVVTNLIDNALKYVPLGGDINIASKIKGDKVFVSIFNNGPSIPDEDLKHIWDRFYKADKSRSSKVSTGLGLSIVRSIMTQLGEDIWVDNKEAVGVTFIFSLKRV